MEIQFKVKPVGIRRLCDKCNGEMRYTDGTVLVSNPQKYKHNCINCGNEEFFEEKYPTIRWIEE